jgi:hypothetical protein
MLKTPIGRPWLTSGSAAIERYRRRSASSRHAAASGLVAMSAQIEWCPVSRASAVKRQPPGGAS